MKPDFVRTLVRYAADMTVSVDGCPILGTVIAGRADQTTYQRFLLSTYQYVRWSGPLLALTAQGLRRRGRYPSLIEIIAAKAEEESPHDQWALEDLKNCGANLDLVKAAIPPPAISAYVEWSRALAASGSPGYLGAAYLLEAISMQRAGIAAENLCAHSDVAGIDRAVTFLRAHGTADVAHVAHLEQLLSIIDDPCDQREVLASAMVLQTLYPRFFAEEVV